MNVRYKCMFIQPFIQYTMLRYSVLNKGDPMTNKKVKGLTIRSVSNKVWSKSRCKGMTKPEGSILRFPNNKKTVKPEVKNITGKKFQKMKVMYEQKILS